MRSCLVEIPYIGFQDPLELLLLKNQKMVEAFLSDTPQETLTDGIGLGSMNRRFEQLDATGPRHSLETGSIRAVVITDISAFALTGWLLAVVAPPRHRSASE